MKPLWGIHCSPPWSGFASLGTDPEATAVPSAAPPGCLLQEGTQEVIVGDLGRQRLVVVLEHMEELLLRQVDAVLPQHLGASRQVSSGSGCRWMPSSLILRLRVQRSPG